MASFPLRLFHESEIPPVHICCHGKGIRMTFRFKASFVAWAPVASHIT